ncbi:MAG: hypothetical protein LBM97_02380 [Candidatus Nomurabacteria bacterium]|jgi:predicted DNA-binding protein YlxM (UPF0122 family)|nr:hypothetical protein [Candidatus Nomurabacteria bacterium]
MSPYSGNPNSQESREKKGNRSEAKKSQKLAQKCEKSAVSDRFSVSIPEMVALSHTDTNKLLHLLRYCDTVQIDYNTSENETPEDVTGGYEDVVDEIRQVQNPITSKEMLGIIAEYQNGAMVKELAKKYGRTRQAIAENLKKHGIDIIYRRFATRGQDQTIVSLYLSGLNSNQVAERFGVSQGAILRCLRANHIPLRPSGKSKQKTGIFQPVSR